MTRLYKGTAAVLGGLLISSGCVERNEGITVARDGSVTIELQYEGTPEELAGGDAMPSAASGWQVKRTVKEENDKIKHVLESIRRFEPREQLPRSFASTDDPDAGLYLDFPTTVRVERRPDGLYYYFHRTYTARPWAYVQHWQELCFDHEVKKLSDKPLDELTPEEREKIVKAAASFEALKQVEFTKIAMDESHPDLPVEHWLVARRALIDVYTDNHDFEEIIETCATLPEQERGDCFDEEAERLLAMGYDAFVASLQLDAGLDDTGIQRFEDAYRRARRFFEITESLGGHVFEIDVRMPGTIVAHNALDDKVEQDQTTSTVTFQFDGKAFRDRTHELIVVSHVGDAGTSRGGSHGRG